MEEREKETQFAPLFDPLSCEELKDRTREGFAAAYATFISIIQGVAFGILVSNSVGDFAELYKQQGILESSLSVVPYSLTSLIILVLVTYEYLPFLVIFRWRLKIWDTIIPFSLGTFEMISISCLTTPWLWWLFTGVFCFVGMLAFHNARENSPRKMFGKRYHPSSTVTRNILAHVGLKVKDGIIRLLRKSGVTLLRLCAHSKMAT